MSKSKTNKSMKFANQVYDEIDRYGRAVWMEVAKGAVVVGALIAFGCLLFWSRSVADPTGSDSLRMTASPLSGSAILGIYTGIAAVVFAIRVGARNSKSKRRGRSNARQIASNSFLSIFSFGCLLASISVGIMALLWLNSPPQSLDIIRTLLACGASLLLAFVSAESVLLTRQDDTSSIRAVGRQRYYKRLKTIVRADETSKLGRQGWAVQASAAFLVSPLVLSAISTTIAPVESSAMFISRALSIELSSVVAFFIIRQIVDSLVGGSTSSVVSTSVMMGLLGLLFWMVAAGTSLPQMTTSVNLGRMAADALLVAGAVITGPLLVMAIFSRPFSVGGSRRVRGFVFDVVMRDYKRRMKRAKAPANAGSKPIRAFNPNAVASALLFWVFPVNFLIAVRSLDEIAAARLKGDNPRGQAWAVFAIIAGGAATIAIIGTLVTLAVTHPDLVWCDSTHEGVCLGRSR